ncbi:MAG: SPOR domain-containing protein, partial [Rugosibacter sp.]
MAENETSADPGLQLKKRARRRLVGAAALALLAVIVLPMVMDREPRPSVQDIQVRIPSQDNEGLAPLPAPKPAAPKPASLPPLEPGATPVAAPPP